jgi:hypothetical protein
MFGTKNYSQKKVLLGNPNFKNKNNIKKFKFLKNK